MRKKLLEILETKKHLNFKDICRLLNIKNKRDTNFLVAELDKLIREETVILLDDIYVLKSDITTYKGTIIVKKEGYGFVSVDDLEEDVFIPAKYVNDAITGDLVLIGVPKNDSNRKRSSEGIVSRIIERGIKKVVGTYDGKYIIDDDKKNNMLVKVNKKQENGAVPGSKVLASITSYQDGFLTAHIDKVIGHIDDPGIDILSIVYRYDIPQDFSKEIMEGLKEIPDYVTDEQRENREDLRDLTTITIDGDDAKDFDDAISIMRDGKDYILYVHIADVSYYVLEGSPLDREAYYRGTSVYLANTVIPMLPHYLSNGICSLNEGVDRLVITCQMRIDAKGVIRDKEIYPSVINSNHRMTYNNVNRMLNGENIYEDIHDFVFLMNELAKILKQKRVLEGSLEFDTVESHIICDEDGKAIDVKPRSRGLSEGIIEEFMLIANQCVAKTIKDRNLPFIYRVHENPTVLKLENMVTVLKSLGIKPHKKPELLTQFDIQKMIKAVDQERSVVFNNIMLRSMMKARYCKDPLGHYGLAFVDYTHFTSPIRRYPDLIVHRCLRRYLFENNYNNLRDYSGVMEDIAEQASKTERRAVDCERDVVKMKCSEYMMDHLGEEYIGHISGVVRFGFYVLLDNTVEGLVLIESLKGHYVFDEEKMQLTCLNSRHSFRIGDKVKVRVVKASKELSQIDFELIEE